MNNIDSLRCTPNTKEIWVYNYYRKWKFRILKLCGVEGRNPVAFWIGKISYTHSRLSNHWNYLFFILG